MYIKNIYLFIHNIPGFLAGKGGGPEFIYCVADGGHSMTSYSGSGGVGESDRKREKPFPLKRLSSRGDGGGGGTGPPLPLFDYKIKKQYFNTCKCLRLK